MIKYINIFPWLTDLIIKLSIGIIFFNFGYQKFIKLINNEGEDIIIMVSNIFFFGSLPVFFSWALALSEVIVIFFLIYGIFSFLPLANLITKIAGILCLTISIVIVYQHIFVWGDNIFTNGPFDFFNASEGNKSVFGQVLFIPISLYILFNNRVETSILNDHK
jgi:hypothetical protein